MEMFMLRFLLEDWLFLHQPLHAAAMYQWLEADRKVSLTTPLVFISVILVIAMS